MVQELTCRCCGEPYSAYALKNDVAEWDDQPDDAYELFMRGEGCPTCNWGEKAGEVSLSETMSEDELEARHAHSLFEGTDEDPVKFL